MDGNERRSGFVFLPKEEGPEFPSLEQASALSAALAGVGRDVPIGQILGWSLGRGRLLAQGRIDELKQPHDRQFEVRVKGDALAFAGLLARRGITAELADDHLLVQLPPGATRQVLWETAGQAGEQVRALRCRRSTLEEIFLRAVAEQD